MVLLDLDRVFDNDRPPTAVAYALAPAVSPAALPADWFVAWDERAAIMEYDGGLHRERAEHLALLDVLEQMRQAGL